MTRGKHVVSFSTMLNHVLKWKVKLFFLSSPANVWSCETIAFHVTKIVGPPLRRGYFSQFLSSFTSPLRRPKIKFYRGYRELGDINLLHIMTWVSIRVYWQFPMSSCNCWMFSIRRTLHDIEQLSLIRSDRSFGTKYTHIRYLLRFLIA